MTVSNVLSDDGGRNSSETISTSAIPRIPLKQFSQRAQRPALLKQLRTALLDIGFLYLTDLEHQLPPSLTARLVATLPVIFRDLSPEQKSTAALINTPHFLGYSSFGTETTAGSRDAREQFEFAGDRGGHDGVNDQATANGTEKPLYTRLWGPNQFPDFKGSDDLRKVVQDYIAAVQDVAKEFLALVNEALDLDAGTLEKFARAGQDRLKLVHYATGEQSEDAQGQEFVQGVGPHKDSSGWLTFLLQASPGTRGLQALSKDGQWLDVPPLEGSLVVNMGQAFEAATNGVCKATTHRVLLPQGMGSRYSVPFFMGVRPSLTKDELRGLWTHFEPEEWQTRESEEGSLVDSPFLRGNFETWGEAQLRTKIRSHRDVGTRWYGDVFDKYVNGG